MYWCEAWRKGVFVHIMGVGRQGLVKNTICIELSVCKMKVRLVLRLYGAATTWDAVVSMKNSYGIKRRILPTEVA